MRAQMQYPSAMADRVAVAPGEMRLGNDQRGGEARTLLDSGDHRRDYVVFRTDFSAEFSTEEDLASRHRDASVPAVSFKRHRNPP
jgi:hypothetical protein